MAARPFPLSPKSLSVRLALRFTVVVAAASVLLSVAFVMLVKSVIGSMQRGELLRAAAEVARASPPLGEPSVPYYVSYLVSDSGGNVLATNDPFLPVLPPTGGSVSSFVERGYFIDGDLKLLYVSEEVASEEFGAVTVVAAMNMDGGVDERLLAGLPSAVALAALPILSISFLLSLFITRRVLRPVGKIALGAERISSSNLGGSLPESGTGDELDGLARTFNALLRRLKADFERERQFTSDVSHELKTPVAVILGQANLLLRWGKDDPAQLSRSLESIRREARSMEAMTTNLLQLSRLDSGRLVPNAEDVDCRAVAERIRGEFAAIAPAASVEVSGGASVRADPELLHQVLTALVSNAVKYAGGSCRVRVEILGRGGSAEISVADDGPGFPPEAIPRVFDRFFRADESHNRAGGTGLGLAIARAAVLAMGGGIRAENDGGAKVTVSLPLAATSPSGAGAL